MLPRLIYFSDCGNKQSVANGKVDYTGRKTTAGSSVPVTCDTGYKLNGNSHITCKKDGLWSSGTCQIIGTRYSHYYTPAHPEFPLYPAHYILQFTMQRN